MVNSTPRPHFTPRKDPVPVLQEAGWAPGPVWTGGKSRPRRDSIQDLPVHSQSLYRLSYRVHKSAIELGKFNSLKTSKLGCYSVFLCTCIAVSHEPNLSNIRVTVHTHFIKFNVTWCYKAHIIIFTEIQLLMKFSFVTSSLWIITNFPYSFSSH